MAALSAFFTASFFIYSLSEIYKKIEMRKIKETNTKSVLVRTNLLRLLAPNKGSSSNHICTKIIT
jgi:hypothetical protein